MVASSRKGPLAGVRRNSTMVFFGFHGSHTHRLATILARRSVPRRKVRAVPLCCYYLAPCSTSFGNIRVLFSGRGIRRALKRIISGTNGGRLHVTRARGCTRIAFFFGNNTRTLFRGRSEVLIGSPGITACSLRPRVDTPVITRGLIRTVGSKHGSLVVLGFTGKSVMNRANICRTVHGTIATISRYIRGIVRTTGTGNCIVLLATSRKGTSCTIGSSNSPGATRSLGSIPFVMVRTKSTIGSIEGKGLTSITPAVLGLVNVRRPTTVAKRPLMWFQSCSPAASHRLLLAAAKTT